MKKLFLYITLIFCMPGFSQSDSIAFTNDLMLKEGIYANYSDFRRDSPIPKDAIVTKDDRSQLDFILKTVTDYKEIPISENGGVAMYDAKKLWGFCQNNTIYINYQGKFYRIPVFGNISNFIGTVEVYYNNYGMYGGMGMGYGGMMGGTGMPVKQRETRQFIFDFYSGEVMDYTLSNLELLLSRDFPLYEEFMKLRKNKRRDMMMLYVRKFNNSHPVKFPVSK